MAGALGKGWWTATDVAFQSPTPAQMKYNRAESGDEWD